MKCDCSKHPVIISYGFVKDSEGTFEGDSGLFIDGGKIGGMIHCSKCGMLRMFQSDNENIRCNKKIELKKQAT